MRTSGLFPAGGAVSLVGVILLVVETARALSGNTLGTVESALTWVGVGLVAVGGVLLVLSVARSDAAISDGGQPADG